MKRLSALIVFVLAFCFLLIDVFPQTDEDENELAFSQGLNFYFVNGYALGYLFNVKESSAMRLALDLSGSFSDSESEGDNNYYGVGQTSKFFQNNESNNSSINVSFSFDYLYYLFKTNYVSIALGGGPFVGIGYQKYTSSGEFRNPFSNAIVKNENTNSTTSYSGGLRSITNIEGFINKNISLFAEAQIRFSRSWSDFTSESKEIRFEYESGNVNTGSGSSWSVGVELVRVGIGIYF